MEKDDQRAPEPRRRQHVDGKEGRNRPGFDQRILVESPSRCANSLDNGQRRLHGEPRRRGERDDASAKQHRVGHRPARHDLRHVVAESRAGARAERDEKRTAESQDQQVDAEVRDEESGA